MDVLTKKLDNLMHSVRGGVSSSLRSCVVCEHCGGDSHVRMQNQESSIRHLENQMSQIASLLKERPSGSLPSTTEANPREHAKAILLRSGRQLEEVKDKQKDKKMEKSEEDESRESGKEAIDAPAEKEDHPRLFADPITHPVRPRIPYPQRLKGTQLDKQFGRFLEIFKKLHINIPFVEVIPQMPSYAKFLKEIFSNKRRLEEYATVKLNEECSAILSRKLPPKLKDPGSFTIPCVIGDLHIDKALMDLGASINLMPLSIFRKLGLAEPKPTTISLQLADRSITYPRGIIEDVLVKVEKFIFPVDFLVLDMEEDIDIPLILGRPFMAIARTIIDV
ncbi:hypothetical protein K2173_007376 [Erythroxylum novogranatense]|uniref:Aspartic peptidase DDI1-type domain-containing protein n=1 Tax=Erythroxylum novogranatense TaxID=1862640 RepID=A0AAV8T632_9ROSI|nr:hypothetical protein K2173_007376 [Erythroxylum novogranatense]